MKKLIFISLILAAGLTAYPQSSRSSREAKSSKSRSSQVASRSSSKSSSRQVKSSSNNQNRQQATKARSSSSSRPAVNRSQSSRSSSPAVKSRSSNAQSRSSAVRSGGSNTKSNANIRSGNSSSRTSRSSGDVRSGSSSSRSSAAVRSGNSSSRSSGAVKSGSSATRSSRSELGSNSRSNSQSASRSNSAQRTSRSNAKSSDKNVLHSTNSRSSVPSKIENSERARSQAKAVKSRDDNVDNVARRSNSSSFDRSNRQGNKTYISNDGKKYKHQNDEVFVRTKYRTDYRHISDLRRSRDFIRVHNHYNNWYHHRHPRRVVVHNHFYRPLAWEIRRVRYPYRAPIHLDLCWTPHLHHSFVFYYPLHENWNHIQYGDYIETASSYEAMNYVGSVKRIYGKVEEVYYSPEDKTYTLYFGAPYPYHDFSAVIPRNVAKSFSWSPSWYFEDEHVWVVGLVEMWEGKPEIVLHDEQQIRRY